MSTEPTQTNNLSSSDIQEQLNSIKATLTEVVANGKLITRQIKELEDKKRALTVQYNDLKFNIEALELLYLETLAREAEEKDESKYSALVIPYIEAYERIKPHLKKMPYEFQEEDLIQMFGYHAEGKSGVLNASDTGTGKTLETVILIMVLAEMNRSKND